MKECSQECMDNCHECEIPQINPEECEDCVREAEENDMEYEFHVNHRNGCWECSNCRGPV